MKFRKSSHAIYKTEYHVVWIPRYRRKVFVKGVKEYAEKLLSHIPELDPDIEVVKLNVQVDHVHMVVVIPPKYAVSNVVGFIKGKSAFSIARQFMGKTKNFTGENFWARGYFVSTVGLDEEVVKAYIREQEKEEEHYEQLSLWK